MTIENMVRSLQEIMRQDDGVSGDAQLISQLVWMLFLKVYDAKEELWEFYEEDYEAVIPEELRWRNWAIDKRDGRAMTGEELLDFVNNDLFKKLKAIQVDETTELRHAVIHEVFEDAMNFMKNGVLLRQTLNVLNQVDFTEYQERHAFNDVYENILKNLQSAGNSGEYYTPRPLTEFIVEMLNPQIGESVADFACGTGGFLISTLDHMMQQVKVPEDRVTIQENLYGIEKKHLPYSLAMTNMILHDLDTPNLLHGNSLSKPIRDYREAGRFDIIVQNPPYGGIESRGIQTNFPVDMQSSDTADLFMALNLYRLKQNGRAGIILPDTFLFVTDGAKTAIKKKLLEEFNLHTIVRLPAGVFAPYTSITVNLLFFDKTTPTKDIWYYEHQVGHGTKNYTKTKKIRNSDFEPERKWWNNREENEFAWKVDVETVKQNNYNLDIKNPRKVEMNQILSSQEHFTYLQASVEEANQLMAQLETFMNEQEAMRGNLVEQNAEEGTGHELLASIQLERKGKKKQELSLVEAKDVPYEIPETWTWTTLKEIGEWGAGSTPSRTNISYYKDGTIPWIKTGDLNDGLLSQSSEMITIKAKEECNMKIRRKGDILIAMYGATVGKLAILDIEAATNQACCSCSTYDGVSNMYLFYYLKSKKEDFIKASFGGAQPNISKNLLEKTLIPLPPFAEQQRIVEKLNALMAVQHRLQEELKTTKAEAAKWYQAILQEAFQPQVE